MISTTAMSNVLSKEKVMKLEKEVINHFKGSETQKFLEKLQKNEITISYKPQQVDLIPKQFSGTVRELLSKISPNIEEIANKLNLTNFLDNDILIN